MADADPAFSPMTLSIPLRAPIAAVVHQHAEEAAVLRHVRTVLVRAPHVRLNQLRRLDDRIAAHLDGLAEAGDQGRAISTAALERPEAGEVFTATVRAIEARDAAGLDRLLALAAALPAARRGLVSAFGWVSAESLQGVVRRLLGSSEAVWREIGLVACRMHHADPAAVLVDALRDPAADLRAAALRTAGELGRTDLIDHVRAAMADDAPQVVFWAAWSACLLGDRKSASKVLAFAGARDGAHSVRALRLFLAASEFAAARELVRSISSSARTAPGGSPASRRVVRACGLLGDVQLVPWLIEQMGQPALARLAGEAFALITGVDLARQDLEASQAAGPGAGPTEDAAADEVALDEDESLPWPDAARVQAWWAAHGEQLPRGQRCLMGAAVSAPALGQILRDGQQRQRILAAEQLCLLAPGTRLFSVTAPAWRQSRRLAAPH